MTELIPKKVDMISAENDSRDLYFAHILGSGYYETAQELAADASRFGITFPYSDFLVLLLRPEDLGKHKVSYLMDRKEVNFILRNTIENCFPWPCCAADVKEQIVAIVNLPASDGIIPSELLEILEEVPRILYDEYSLVLNIVTSRICHSSLGLAHAMHEAELVRDYLAVMGIEQVITTYDELTYQHTPPQKLNYAEFETKLLGCARTNDFASVRLMMHELLVSQKDSARPSIDIFRFRLYGAVNTMLFLLEDIRGSVSNEFFDRVNPGHRLTHAETIEDLVTALDDILLQLEQEVSGAKTAAAPVWGEQIQNYVMEHFCDPDLTVASLADALRITPTYCSRMFKQCTGQRLFDFIQLQRLNAAKALLNSDLSLGAIAEQCGFSSSLTMSRAFKRYEGAAPSAIREYNR